VARTSIHHDGDNSVNIVYKYGTHSGVSLTDDWVDQLRLAHDLYNDLVRARLDHDDQRRDGGRLVIRSLMTAPLGRAP
jgi:hypothetical protein